MRQRGLFLAATLLSVLAALMLIAGCANPTNSGDGGGGGGGGDATFTASDYEGTWTWGVDGGSVDIGTTTEDGNAVELRFRTATWLDRRR